MSKLKPVKVVDPPEGFASELRFGGRVFSIVYSERLNEGRKPLDGYCDMDALTIYIAVKDYARHVLADNVIHESLHYILRIVEPVRTRATEFEWTEQAEEQFVLVLENGICSLLRENPWLAALYGGARG